MLLLRQRVLKIKAETIIHLIIFILFFIDIINIRFLITKISIHLVNFKMS